MIEDIRTVQQKIEGDLFALQPVIEETAHRLYESDPDLLTRYLTDYSVRHAQDVVNKWRHLGEYLITKYNDGYVQDTPGKAVEKRDILTRGCAKC
jgi:dipeptidase